MDTAISHNTISSIYNQFGRQVGFAKPTEGRSVNIADEAQISGVKDRITLSRSNKDSSKQDTSPQITADKAKSDREKDQRIQQEVQRLRAIEEKVKAHEQAHKSAGGQFTGPVSYTYTTGPDGKRYITGGEVAIMIVEGKTPEETIRNMEIVRRAALAPADPSPQDRAVAAQATQIQQKAQAELAKQRAEERQAKSEGSDNASGDNPTSPAAGFASSQKTSNPEDSDAQGLRSNRKNNKQAINAYNSIANFLRQGSLSIFA